MELQRRLIIAFGVAVACLASFGCEDKLNFNNNNCVHGEGQLVTKTLTLEDFSQIDNQGTADISVTQGSTQKVIAIGQANIIDKVNLEVVDGLWNVHLNGKCFTDFELAFEVQVPALSSIAISGTGNILVADFGGQENLTVDISGTGNMDFQKYEGCEKIEARISGTGNINFHENWGGLVKEDILISGTGNFRAFPLITNKCDVNLSATGTCQVYVKEELDVILSGSGAVQYMGSPKVNANITGVGVVQRIN